MPLSENTKIAMKTYVYKALLDSMTNNTIAHTENKEKVMSYQDIQQLRQLDPCIKKHTNELKSDLSYLTDGANNGTGKFTFNPETK